MYSTPYVEYAIDLKKNNVIANKKKKYTNYFPQFLVY